MADEVHEVGGVFTVMNRERAIEADIERVLTEEARPDGMKRSGPIQRIRHWCALWAQHLTDDPPNPSLHPMGGAAREGEQQHPPRIASRHDQVRDAMSERIGLAGTRSRNNEKWLSLLKGATPVLDGTSLFGVEFSEVRCSHGQGPLHPR